MLNLILQFSLVTRLHTNIIHIYIDFKQSRTDFRIKSFNFTFNELEKKVLQTSKAKIIKKNKIKFVEILRLDRISRIFDENNLKFMTIPLKIK